MVGPLTYLDVILLTIALLSGLLAMYRGFTREFLSIISWGLAAAAAAYFFWFHPGLGVKYLNPYFQNETLSLIIFCAIIFIVVLIVIHFLTISFSDAILNSHIGAIDRTLGLLFGILRGFLLVAIIYTLLSLFIRESDYPKWVAQSQSYPYLQRSAQIIIRVFKKNIPDNFKIPGKDETEPTTKSDQQSKRQQQKSLAARIEQASAVNANKKAYEKSARSGMDHLIEMQQNQ